MSTGRNAKLPGWEPRADQGSAPQKSLESEKGMSWAGAKGFTSKCLDEPRHGNLRGRATQKEANKSQESVCHTSIDAAVPGQLLLVSILVPAGGDEGRLHLN
jgi:hypothetical protein